MVGRIVYIYKDGKVVPKDEPRLGPIGISYSSYGSKQHWRYLQHKTMETLAVPKRLLFGEEKTPGSRYGCRCVYASGGGGNSLRVLEGGGFLGGSPD